MLYCWWSQYIEERRKRNNNGVKYQKYDKVWNFKGIIIINQNGNKMKCDDEAYAYESQWNGVTRNLCK